MAKKPVFLIVFQKFRILILSFDTGAGLGAPNHCQMLALSCQVS